MVARITGLTWVFGIATLCDIMAQVDTTYLAEVRVYGLPVTSHAVGAKVEQFSIGGIGMLTDQLLGVAPLYIKSYGNNQLSTISLRGTTASQTAVLWNGININSPTLGQSDLALIPMYLFDELSIRYGGSSAMYGSDAIGGSILVGQQQAEFRKGTTVTFDQQVASFGRFDTGIKVGWGNDRWQFRTKVIRTSLENDFPYESPAVGYAKRQVNAAVRNFGIDQQVHLRIASQHFLTLEAMYTDNHRQVQPPVTNDVSGEVLEDRNTRLSLGYNYHGTSGILTATAAYVNNDQDYINGGVTNTNKSDQLVFQLSFDQHYGTRMNVRYGVSYSRFHAGSENFAGNLSDDRFDAFASARYSITPKWLLNLNLRQALYESTYAPFAPSLGTEITLMENDRDKFSLRGQGSRSYRVPTLNDRYWIPGGNPSLMPEDAWQVETGVRWNRSAQKISVEMDIAAHRGWVEEMILWRPTGSYWSPTNLQQVDLYGAEFSARATSKNEHVVIRSSLQYSFTKSINKKGLDAFDQSTVGKQLPYVPVHNARLGVSVDHRSWSLFANAAYTGLRYTALDNLRASSLEQYMLADAGLSRTLRRKRTTFVLAAHVRNIFDVYYETLLNHAMPGRNAGISVNIKWNNNAII